MVARIVGGFGDALDNRLDVVLLSGGIERRSGAGDERVIGARDAVYGRC